MSSDEYVHRKLVHYNFEQTRSLIESDFVEVANWASFSIKVKDINTVLDFGQFMYSERKKSLRSSGTMSLGRTSLVVLTSLKPERKDLVASFVEWFYGIVTHSGQVTKSHLEVYGLVVTFLNWCDEKTGVDYLSSKSTIRKSYSDYTSYLIERVRRGEIKQNTAARTQGAIVLPMSEMFNFTSEVDLTAGITNIKRIIATAIVTTPPNETDLGIMLKYCYQLFNQLCDFVILKTDFPHKITVAENDYWMMPSVQWVLSESKNNNRASSQRPSWQWNYKLGRISTFEEILDLKGISLHSATNEEKRVAKEQKASAEHDLKRSNIGCRSQLRDRIGQLAHNCYLFIYLAATGSNLQQAINLDIDSKDYTKRIQGFKTAKGRASGAEVEYHIGTRLVPLHKKFIKLRDYFVATEPSYQGLFFKNSECQGAALKRIPENTISQLYIRLRGMFDYDAGGISSRELRSNKSDVLVNSVGLATTAMLIQNNLKTVDRHYSSGSPNKAGKELTQFYEGLDRLIVTSETATNKFIESSVGLCKSIGNPMSTENEPVIKPDCHQPEGCFFCDKYVLRVTDTDVRKLCSVLYVINETSNLAKSEEHFLTVFGEVISRVEEILSMLKSRNSKARSLVERIKIDVDSNENLDKYWQNKLDMLVKMGVI
jgi:hypothetical protein